MPEERRTIVHYAEEADHDDPFQHLAWGLTQWPAFGDMAEMPSPTPLTPYQSEFLCRLGFRYHPELAVLHKVPDPDSPGRARFIDHDEWLKLQEAGNGDVKTGIANQDAFDMLARINPAFAERINGLSPDERDAEMQAMQEAAEKSLQDLAGLRSMLKVKDE